jgi:hypothetical protein
VSSLPSNDNTVVSAKENGCQEENTIETEVERLLNRAWLLSKPDVVVQRILISGNPPNEYSNAGPLCVNNTSRDLSRDFSSDKVGKKKGSFLIVRDDLLHPIMGGNKLRKMDALLPALQSEGVTDVLTCGGCQSAHTAAVAVACAERGLRAHVLLRGEALKIPTGYNLLVRAKLSLSLSLS